MRHDCFHKILLGAFFPNPICIVLNSQKLFGVSLAQPEKRQDRDDDNDQADDIDDAVHAISPFARSE
jgi:hypothetical protein